MNRWLVDEVKWSREKALEAQTRAENLADPAWVKRRMEAIRRDEQNVLESVRRWMRLVSERNMLKSDEERADEAERATRNAIYWTGLAEDASARLAATDDDAALFDAEVSP